MTKFNSSYNGTTPFSDTCFQLNLAANVSQSASIPGISGKKFVATFSYPANASVYVGNNVSATSPASGTSTSTPNLEFKPTQKFVVSGDELSLITPDAGGAQVGISLLELP